MIRHTGILAILVVVVLGGWWQTTLDPKKRLQPADIDRVFLARLMPKTINTNLLVVSHGLGAFRPLDRAIAEVTEPPASFPQARTLAGRQSTKVALALIVDPASKGPAGALDRAGLVMAAANVRADGSVSVRGHASHGWWGTQFVALSASEIGVGRGVLRRRRARHAPRARPGGRRITGGQLRERPRLANARADTRVLPRARARHRARRRAARGQAPAPEAAEVRTSLLGCVDPRWGLDSTRQQHDAPAGTRSMSPTLGELPIVKQRVAMRHVILAGPVEQELASAGDEPTSAEMGKVARSHGAHAARKRVKILFFAANTSAGEQLALDEEYRAIEQAIRGARHRDAFRLIPKLAARRSDLQDALLEHSPDVVHFACHGSSHAEILLLSDGPGSEPVPAAALASLFGVLRDNLALVVFNACFASEQASAIHRCVGLAIGMRARIEDRAAIAFASALYGALAYGRSVRDAFDLGVVALDSRQNRLPQLFSDAGLDPRTVHLVEDARPAALASPL